MLVKNGIKLVHCVLLEPWLSSFVKHLKLRSSKSKRVACSFHQARHGTRGPTKKRIKELEGFADRLEKLAADAEKASSNADLLPAWIKGWKSPWEGKKVGGELLPKGEEELYDLAQRYRNRFPEIFSDGYHPDVYPIIATQVILHLRTH